MSDNQNDEKAKKAAKKAKLKADADRLGIPYEVLKAQKKEKKESKRKREAEKLNQDSVEYEGGEDRQREKKRMRTWSRDFDAESNVYQIAEAEEKAKKRLRTRSMDKAEENAKIVRVEKSQTPEEWRKSHNITIRGYGKSTGDEFPDPFIEFSDAPFNPTIQRTLKAAGFERPTFIQSQVSFYKRGIDEIYLSLISHNSFLFPFNITAYWAHVLRRGQSP